MRFGSAENVGSFYTEAISPGRSQCFPVPVLSRISLTYLSAELPA